MLKPEKERGEDSNERLSSEEEVERDGKKLWRGLDLSFLRAD
jgi:hypothetical protein